MNYLYTEKVSDDKGGAVIDHFWIVNSKHKFAYPGPPEEVRGYGVDPGQPEEVRGYGVDTPDYSFLRGYHIKY